MSKPVRDISGLKFGLWIVAEHVSGPKWICECACGIRSVVWSTNLISGKSTSCGCDRPQKMRAKISTHGMSGSDIFDVWNGMIQRCYNPKNPSFKSYGARGIKVCDSWRASIHQFDADVGPRPTPRHTVDRINNDGNYEPANCHWATITEQANNRRTNRRVSVGGENMTLAQASRKMQVNHSTVRARLRRGWTIERALQLALREVMGCQTDTKPPSA